MRWFPPPVQAKRGAALTRRLLERIGNPLEWSDINKALVVQALQGPMAFVLLLRGRYMIIAGVMVHSAYGILSESVRDLLDVALDEGVQLQVLRWLATHFEDYREFHGVRSRRAGSAMFIEVFLEFDPDRRMADVQAVIDDMRGELMRAIPGSFVSIVPITKDVNVGGALGQSAATA